MTRNEVLGIGWRHTDDMLVIDVSGISQLANECVPTKRNVTSIIGRFYDPLGFLSPLTIARPEEQKVLQNLLPGTMQRQG